MPNLKTTQTKSATIVSVTVNAVGVDPIGFLKYTQSEKSGLWTKGDGWIAHSGCLPVSYTHLTLPTIYSV